MRTTHWFLVSLMVGVHLLSAPAHGYVLKGQGWEASELHVHVDPSVLAVHAKAERALQGAAEAWAATSAPDLRLHLESQPLDYSQTHDVTIEVLTHEWPFSPSRLASTVITRRGSGGPITATRILINGVNHRLDVVSGASDPDSYDLQSVLVHELGHVLGLGDECEKPTEVMYQHQLPCDVSRRTIAGGDHDGIEALYANHAAGCAAADISPLSAVLWLVVCAWRRARPAHPHNTAQPSGSHGHWALRR